MRGADKNQDMENENGYEEGKCAGTGAPAPLKAELLSLPAEGGGFAACDYVGPEMAAFCQADPEVLVETWLAELLADRFRSGAKIERGEDRPEGVRRGHQAPALCKHGGAHRGKLDTSTGYVRGLENRR